MLKRPPSQHGFCDAAIIIEYKIVERILYLLCVKEKFCKIDRPSVHEIDHFSEKRRPERIDTGIDHCIRPNERDGLIQKHEELLHHPMCRLSLCWPCNTQKRNTSTFHWGHNSERKGGEEYGLKIFRCSGFRHRAKN